MKTDKRKNLKTEISKNGKNENGKIEKQQKRRNDNDKNDARATTNAAICFLGTPGLLLTAFDIFDT